MIKLPFVRYTITHPFGSPLYVCVEVAMYTIFQKKKLITGPKTHFVFPPQVEKLPFTLPTPTFYVIVYLPLAGARLSASAAAIVPSLSRRVSSDSALPTTTSVSPSMRIYSFGSCPGPGSFPGG